MTDELRHLVRFHRKHFDAIVSGEKVTTVRWDESVQVGPSTFVFDDHPTASPLAGHVTSVRRYRLDELTAEQAHAPVGTDMTRFAEQLRENYYPNMPDDAVVDVVELLLVAPSRQPSLLESASEPVQGAGAASAPSCSASSMHRSRAGEKS